MFFGGESPAWPPALLEQIRLPDSQTGTWEYVSETNVKICGMKATNSAMYVFTNGTQLSEFKSDFGSRYFTNNITWQTYETITLEYVCSNYLGKSANKTILTIQPIPEISVIGYRLSVIGILFFGINRIFN